MQMNNMQLIGAFMASKKYEAAPNADEIRKWDLISSFGQANPMMSVLGSIKRAEAINEAVEMAHTAGAVEDTEPEAPEPPQSNVTNIVTLLTEVLNSVSTEFKDQGKKDALVGALKNVRDILKEISEEAKDEPQSPPEPTG